MNSSTERARQAILDVVAAIPRGKVMTYGAVARQAGRPRHSRLVGRLLSALPAEHDLPWHRVLAAGGRVALPEGSSAREEQLSRLAGEGIEAARGRVSLREHGWQATVDDLDRWLWKIGDEN
jgi:methylated-DNA-protein-cysteine methyltransferase-like protein